MAARTARRLASNPPAPILPTCTTRGGVPIIAATAVICRWTKMPLIRSSGVGWRFVMTTTRASQAFVVACGWTVAPGTRVGAP